MAIKLQVSNSLTQLAKNLSENLTQENKSVFTPHFLVTQTDGMNNWLKLQMAQNMGIAANYKFLKPNDLIQQVYNLFSTWGGDKPLSADNQTWLLYKLLAESEFTSRFKTIANYYLTAGPDTEIKRLALAQKIADLFDQYQIYRPQLIKEWNAYSLAKSTTNNWQKYLWIKTKQLLNQQLLDKTLIADYIFEALTDPQNQRKLIEKMPAAHLFGLSITTNYHLELFNKIGQYINVWFYIINPAPAVYWFEDRSEKQLAIFKNKSFKHDIQNQGNALLTNWGQIIKDTFSLLFKNDNLLNAYETINIEEPKTDTLLHCIQQDIFNNAVEADRNTLNIAKILDGSLIINSCYTPIREVEVLYNYLVGMVDNQKIESFSAREIVVMVSDIDAYAPYIKAVFNNAPYKFPFTIADESIATDDTLTAGLKAILTLNSENFKAENVLKLLDLSYIKNRFGITDLGLIRNVIMQANIRFGINGELANDSVFMSWQYGLKRIIYGICISGEEEYFDTEPSIFPLDVVEGNHAQTVISFCHFVQVLINSITERDKKRDLANWVLYIKNVLHNLIFEPNEESDEDYDLLINKLATYSELEGILTEQISYEVFTHNLLKNLSSATRTSTFVAGGITFCSLIPMRSIPFKVVALLGLNFDKFPRKDKPISFNLMDKRQAGDRNIKDNDKHLFLETLLSAQQYLYISYLGQSVKDNTNIPPSVLVDELVDYLQSACADSDKVATHLITKHPLHSFSRKYNSTDTRLVNYLNENNTEWEATNAIKTETQNLDFTTIDLDKMITFFKHPFKGFYNNVLKIYYQKNDVLLPETEIFDLNKLQQWDFKQALLRMDDEEIIVAQNQWLKTGKLPLKNMALLNLQNLKNEVSPVKTLLLNCVGYTQEENKNVEIKINETTIKTQLKGIYGGKLVQLCWSKNEKKYLLSAYINYLAAAAAGLVLELNFISTNQNKVFKGITISKTEAQKRLNHLLDLYKKGHQELLIFNIDFKIKPNDVDSLDNEKFSKVIDKKLNNYTFPCDDRYLITEYEKGIFNTHDAAEKYKQNAELLLKPLEEVFNEYNW